MHDLALGRAHRVQRDRPAGAGGPRRGLVGLAVQHLLAPLAVARGVDRHPHRLVAARVAVGDLEREVLDGVDRLAVAPDEEPEILAVQRGADPVVVLDHLEVVDVEPERRGDLPEQLLDAIGSLGHLRLPERFFLRRGGAGGGPLGLPLGGLPLPPTSSFSRVRSRPLSPLADGRAPAA